MNAIAYRIDFLQEDVDYNPVWTTTNPQIQGDPNKNYPGYYSGLQIFKFVITQNNSVGNIKLWCKGNEEPVEVPLSSFKVGEQYDMYLNKYQLTDESASVKILGFFAKNMPVELI